jgi:CDGSH-type Zn-finger protein
MSKEYLDEEDVVSTFENTVLASDGKHIKFKKVTLIQKEGDLSLKVYIVKKGLLKSYVLDEKGREHVFMFAPEGCVEKNLSCQLSKSKVAVSLCKCKKSSVFPYCDNSSC